MVSQYTSRVPARNRIQVVPPGAGDRFTNTLLWQPISFCFVLMCCVLESTAREVSEKCMIRIYHAHGFCLQSKK